MRGAWAGLLVLALGCAAPARVLRDEGSAGGASSAFEPLPPAVEKSQQVDPKLYGDKRLWQQRGCTVLGLVGVVAASTLFTLGQSERPLVPTDARVLGYQGSVMATSMGIACLVDALLMPPEKR